MAADFACSWTAGRSARVGRRAPAGLELAGSGDRRGQTILPGSLSRADVGRTSDRNLRRAVSPQGEPLPVPFLTRWGDVTPRAGDFLPAGTISSPAIAGWDHAIRSDIHEQGGGGPSALVAL